MKLRERGTTWQHLDMLLGSRPMGNFMNSQYGGIHLAPLTLSLHSEMDTCSI